jgi:DNA-binding response OmpR family regulator
MEAKYRVLVAEDEHPLRQLIVATLKRAGYDVHGVGDGQEAISFLKEHEVDLVVLDIIMPRLNGFQVCQWLRERSDVPVVMLTALDNTEDVLKGFDSGADDYITKPFTFEELKARIEAILRRVEWLERRKQKKVIAIGFLRIDADAHTVTLNGGEVHLTPMEFELLYFLMSRAGEAVSKETLFTEVWGYDFVGGTNLVEVGIRRLREKIEETPSHPTYIQTVRGVGYRFIESLSERAR